VVEIPSRFRDFSLQILPFGSRSHLASYSVGVGALSLQIKNMWSYNSILPYAFMAFTASSPALLLLLVITFMQGIYII